MDTITLKLSFGKDNKGINVILWLGARVLTMKEGNYKHGFAEGKEYSCRIGLDLEERVNS